MSGPLTWQPVDLHTASNGRSCTIHDPHTLSVPLNTQCLLTAPAHWVKPHGTESNPVPTWKTPRTGGRANCSVVLSLCARPQRDVHTPREPRDLTTHCRAAVYVCRYTHAHTKHLTHRLSTHPTHSHEHPGAGIQGPADAG